MVHSIQGSDPTGLPPNRETSQERQRLQEIQFETALLGIFISVSGQNSSFSHQLSQIKNGLTTGQPATQLASNVNLLITQINTTIIPGKAKFPSFQFSDEGSQTQALTHLAIGLEKCLNTVGEKSKISWKSEETLFGNLSHLIAGMGQLTSQQALSKLNEIIASANTSLPQQYQLPLIGG